MGIRFDFLKTISFFVIIILFFPATINAQSDNYIPGFSPGLPVKGYVVLNDGDTLKGEVIWRFKYVENNLSGIRFIAEGGENFVFNANDIIAFGDEPFTWKNENPVPRQIKTEDYLSLPSYKKEAQVFMHRLLDGRITVFQNRNSSVILYSNLKLNNRIEGEYFIYSPVEGLSISPEYMTQPSVVKYISRFSGYYVRKDNGELIKVDRKNYKKIFDTLFSDCPNIANEITKNPVLKEFRYFMILTEIYNKLYGNYLPSACSTSTNPPLPFR
jgi:hypothetical protein